MVVNNDALVPYDHLIIATGTQYMAMCPTQAKISEGVNNNHIDSFPVSPDTRMEGYIPHNMLVINDEYDAAVALYWLENNGYSSENVTGGKYYTAAS